jgi:hypothetical protein
MQSGPQRKLTQLVEIYAMRTRQLSEAIAVLGGDVIAGRQIDETIAKIKKLSRLAEQAGLDLFAFVVPRTDESRNE